MLVRFLVLVLAQVLAWISLATLAHDAPDLPSAEVALAMGAAAADAPQPPPGDLQGGVADHHLDDVTEAMPDLADEAVLALWPRVKARRGAPACAPDARWITAVTALPERPPRG